MVCALSRLLWFLSTSSACPPASCCPIPASVRVPTACLFLPQNFSLLLSYLQVLLSSWAPHRSCVVLSGVVSWNHQRELGCDPGFGDPQPLWVLFFSFSLHGNGHDLHRVGLGVMFRSQACELPNGVPVHMVSDEYWFRLLAPSPSPHPCHPSFSPLVPCKLGSLIKHRGGFSRPLSNHESAPPERRV